MPIERRPGILEYFSPLGAQGVFGISVQPRRLAGVACAAIGSLKKEGRMITIRELATRHGVTLRALRFYEKYGLIEPKRDGKVRLYSEEDAARVALILKAKALGFLLAEIPELIVERDGRPRLVISRARTAQQITRMREQLAETEAAITALRTLAQGTDSIPEFATA
jgi:DNA-binding transcriptional MerR regulator